MRILIIGSPWLGGSGTVAFNLAKNLSLKHFVVFLSFDFPYRKIDKTNFMLVNAIPFKYPLFPHPIYHSSLISSLIEIVKKFRIELIHSHYSLVFGEAGGLGKIMIKTLYDKDIKFVLTFHGTDLVGFNFDNLGETPFKNINQYLISVADKVTTVSNFAKSIILRNYKVREDKISVIYNFFDENVFYRYTEFEERKYIIHVSNFRKVKQADKVLKAFVLVKNKIPKHIKLLFVGDGPEKKKLISFVKEKNLMDRVSFRKIFDPHKLNEILNESLVSVYPSLFENFPLSILESMACGTPVIANYVGGIPELINEECGYFIKNIKQPEKEIAKGILKIVNDKNKWSLYSYTAFERAQMFTSKRIIKEYEGLYKNLIKKY